MEMLSDLKLLSGTAIASEMLSSSSSPGKTGMARMRPSKDHHHRSSPEITMTSPTMTKGSIVERKSGNKSSLFTVDSLLAGGPHNHHKDNNNMVVHEFSDLSPPATPPSPAVHKPMAMPNSPMFAPYPFPYPGNLLIPGLSFPHHPAMHSWHGIKFSSNHHNDGPNSKSYFIS